MSSIFQAVMQAQDRFQDMLLTKRNVVGVGSGYKQSGGVITDEPAVVILVRQKLPIAALTDDDRVPGAIDGVRTDVVESGEFQALQTLGPRDRHRPTIPGGVSIGHFKITAGTLGVMVRDRTTGERFLLSNNHVLANSNEARKGDAILQPGPTDGGQNPADAVATLERFVPIKFIEGDVNPPEDPPEEPPEPPGGGDGTDCDLIDAFVAIGNLLARLSGSAKRVQATAAAEMTPTAKPTTGPTAQVETNTADCALGRPNDPTMFEDEIRNIGVVRETTAPSLGMRVRKSGRTTDYTESDIALLNATVNVTYNTSKGTRTARFTGQVIADAFSQGGDSGSLVVESGSNRAVGLLFAGSSLSTIFTPIDVVLDALNATLQA